MKNIRRFLGSLFGETDQSQAGKSDMQETAQRTSTAKPMNPAHDGQFKPGNRIGEKYVVRDKLGEGGFGIVYLATQTSDGSLCALKTFREGFLDNPDAREAFKKEATVWVGLDDHPCILAARWVEETYGRLFVEMDYIPKDKQGRVTLTDHIGAASGAFELNQALEWAVQFCLGMEHANGHGIRCHRDIKPGNILITPDGMLKIADFGLAAAAETALRTRTADGESMVAAGTGGIPGMTVFGTRGKGWCGTPGYVAPEVYRGERADVRSDIYSFGAVLWQMAAGSAFSPFHVEVHRRDDPNRWVAAYMEAVYRRQKAGNIRPTAGPMQAIVHRCLAFHPHRRYRNFSCLRKDLEALCAQWTERQIRAPEPRETSTAFWANKGASLDPLGRYEEAIACYDKALEIDPSLASAWSNKGNSLHNLGRYEQAVACHDKAVEIDPSLANAWSNKGVTLGVLGRYEEAIACYDKALEIDPDLASAWSNKGNSFEHLGRYEEAVACHDNALEIDPRLAGAWTNKGKSLYALSRYEEAVACYDKALEIDPRDADAWSNKGASLTPLGYFVEAITCYNKALEIDPHLAAAWSNKGASFQLLGSYEKAVACYDKALETDPRVADVWFNKAIAEESTGRSREAVDSYRKFLEFRGSAFPDQAAQVLERLRILESGKSTTAGRDFPLGDDT